MKTVIQRYLLKIDKINRLTSSLQEQILVAPLSTEESKRWFEDILIDAYIEGFGGAAYLLDEHTPIQANKVDSAVQLRYGPNEPTIIDKFVQYCRNQQTDKIKPIVESEFHRVYNTAASDCAEQSGYDTYKTWLTMLDDKVRDTHSYLEGITIPSDAMFYTYDGDSALYPGGFKSASNNANCRCILQYTRA